jgi:probable F420-dependent oxidoreductase
MLHTINLANRREGGQGIVRFGIGHDFRNLNPSKRSFAQMYAQSLDRIVLAEELGYDYVFLGEHHLTADGHAPSLFPILGAIAARTSRIRLSTYVYLLPLHHPLAVAEDVIVVDLLSDGRMELGVGLGYRQEEFDAFGVDRTDRATLMDESCEILLRVWTEEGWSHDGRHFQLRDITVAPKPVQRPHPTLWISARNPRAARRAARLRSPLMIAPAPYTDDAGTVYRAYADALSAGEDPASYEVMGSFTVQVVPAGQTTSEPLGAGPRADQFRDWYARDGDLATDADRIANPSEKLRRQMGITGEPKVCIAAIEALLAEVPYTTLMVGGLSPVQLERVASSVAPHFKIPT